MDTEMQKLQERYEARGILICAYKLAIAKTNFKWKSYSEWRQMEGWRIGEISAEIWARETIKDSFKTNDEYDEFMLEVKRDLVLFHSDQGECDNRELEQLEMDMSMNRNSRRHYRNL